MNVLNHLRRQTLEFLTCDVSLERLMNTVNGEASKRFPLFITYRVLRNNEAMSSESVLWHKALVALR